jgi:uncharacterized membrane protein
MRQSAQTTFRGTLRMHAQTAAFLACGDRTSLAVPEPSPDLSRIYAEAGGDAEGVFVELRGRRQRNTIIVTELIRMEPESRGCGEDAPRWEFRAFGNEPFWTVEVWPRRLVLYRPGEDAVSWDGPRRSRSGSARSYTAADARHQIELMIAQRPCRDTMTGSYYSFSASALIDGRRLEGCARAR